MLKMKKLKMDKVTRRRIEGVDLEIEVSLMFNHEYFFIQHILINRQNARKADDDCIQAYQT
jgi:hypothetical protein